jgi:carboxyl-terminal processing protease
MLTGIGPILGDGVVGEFVGANGKIPWFYQDGKTGTRNTAGLETVSLNLQDSPLLVTPLAPVAVLIDSSTASSAEAVTIAFHGRESTRFFGEHTAGKSNAVQPFKLPDGAELYLTAAIDADRNGKTFPDGIAPDEAFPAATALPQEGNDPVVTAAQTWLASNAGAPLLTATAAAAAAAPPVPAPKPKVKRKKVIVHQGS